MQAGSGGKIAENDFSKELYYKSRQKPLDACVQIVYTVVNKYERSVIVEREITDGEKGTGKALSGRNVAD